MNIIAIDPSGNFEDGKGHTGIAILRKDNWSNVELKTIRACDFGTRYEYWVAIINAVLNLYTGCKDDLHVVIETYVTRSVGYTVGKQPETAMFIGALIYVLEKYCIRYTFQTPSVVKTRFPDDILITKCETLEKTSTGRITNTPKRSGVPHITNDHERDALRHLLYFTRYTLPKLKLKEAKETPLFPNEEPSVKEE